MNEVNITAKKNLSKVKDDFNNNTSINDRKTEVIGKVRPLIKLNNKENKGIKVGLVKSTSESSNGVQTNVVKVKGANFKNPFLLVQSSTESDIIETKFITKLMRKGKKEKAEITLLKALKKVEQELLKKEAISLSALKDTQELQTLAAKSTEKKKSSISNIKQEQKALGSSGNNAGLTTKINKSVSLSKILERIIENAKPLVRLKKIRIAGTTHQKPVALTKKQAESDAIKRIITNAKARSEKSSTLKLAKELEEIYLNIMSNKTLTEVRDLHKLAEANKANITLK